MTIGTVIFAFIDSNDEVAEKIVRINSINKIKSLKSLSNMGTSKSKENVQNHEKTKPNANIIHDENAKKQNLLDLYDEDNIVLDEKEVEKDKKFYKITGILLAIFAGCCYGSCFDFVAYIQYHCPNTNDYKLCSKNQQD